MTVTARDIIIASLEEIGAHSPGETIANEHIDRGFKEMNKMLSGWCNEDLMKYAYVEQSFDLVPDQNTYIVGAAPADLVGERPTDIKSAWTINPTSGGERTTVSIIEAHKWFQLNKLEKGEPEYVFYDTQSPRGELKIYPKPNVAWKFGFLMLQNFTQFTNLNDVVELPPGYEEAISSNLSIKLAPFFSKTPSPVTITLAATYKGNIKSKNIRYTPVTFDPMIPQYRGRANILTGE